MTTTMTGTIPLTLLTEEPAVTIMWITPDLARWLLDRNLANRRVKPYQVTRLVGLMRKGKFDFNGDSIRIATDGRLLDGQHRLMAVIETGISIEQVVVSGLSPSAQETMDQGVTRNANDVFAANGIKHGNRLVGAIRMVHRWDMGERSVNGFSSGHHVSLAEALEQVFSDSIWQESVAVCSALDKLAQARVTQTLFILATRANPTVAAAFFTSLITGADLRQGSPILTLRNYWMNQPKGNVGLNLQAGVKAWNAYVDGRDLKKIAWSTGVIPEVAA